MNYFYSLLMLVLMAGFLACPNSPQTADCEPGFLPCEEDRTRCCEVECPPGQVLGGTDSTDCIPVDCPQGYYLCGADSTECCHDTTSSLFIWTIDTFGADYYTSIFSDVAYLNENDIWAVGEIYSNVWDTVYYESQLYLVRRRYNAAPWDGSQWEFFSILFSTLDGNGNVSYRDPRKIHAVQAYASDDVWFFGRVRRFNWWNGTEFVEIYDPEYDWYTDGDNFTM